tara:strand:+ start:235 stop:507 length:273 start_codon:yes stop_codon:yes gene_type:complete
MFKDVISREWFRLHLFLILLSSFLNYSYVDFYAHGMMERYSIEILDNLFNFLRHTREIPVVIKDFFVFPILYILILLSIVRYKRAFKKID